jgi:site-specific DNA recombinase
MLAIYTRLSVNDEDSNSIQNQIREGKEFAKSNGFKDYEIYNEGAGVSGGLEIEDRPQLFQLMNDIVDKKITSAWFRNQNRLERDSNTFHRWVYSCLKFKVDVYYGDKGLVDYSDPSTYFLASIMSSIGKYNKDLQGVQTKKSLKDNAREGKTHGISPYGYTKDSNRFIKVDEEEAKIIKRIYAMSLSGMGTNKIAAIFNSEKIQTRYNKIAVGTITTKFKGVYLTKEKKDIRWAGNTIRNIITNPMYYGERHLNSGIYSCPEIIDKELWLKAQNNLIANRNTNGKVYKYDYLLKDKITCHKCLGNYYGKSRQDKSDHYYMCSSKRYKNDDGNSASCGNRSINIDILENFIWKRFFADKVLIEVIQKHFKNTSTQDRLSEIENERKNLNQSISENKKKRERAVKLVLNAKDDDDLSEDDFKDALKGLKTEMQDFEYKLSKLNKDQKSLETLKEDSTSMVDELSNILENATFKERREIIEKYIDNIDVFFSNGFYLLRISFNIYNLNLENEVYFIDRSYNIIFELCNKFVLPLSNKLKKLSDDDLFAYANNCYDEWSKEIDLTS